MRQNLNSASKASPSVRLALRSTRGGKTQQALPENGWSGFKIVCFGRLAEVCGEYLNKGRHVYLEGRLQTRKWEDRGGEKRTAIEVVANQMQILDRAPQNGNGAKVAESSKPSEPVDEGDNPFNGPGSETTDQIPF